MKNQSGRSMVEMLAVMAIMGVLAVTGIVAYNYAMVKHQANELVHKANLAYVDVMTHDSLENWSELKITSLDGVALQGLIYKEAGFVLIENVDKNVCNAILKDKTNFSLMTIDNQSFATCNAKNSMIFDFANAGDIGLKCISGHCPLEDEGQYCSSNTGTCVMKTDCTNETLWSYKTDTCDTCEGINGDLAPVFKDNDCISCAENDDTKPVWDAKNKKCVNCLIDTDCDVNSFCNNNTCELTFEGKCTDGFIVTGKVNNQKYCANPTAATSKANASSWCTSRGMNLVPLATLCPNNPALYGTCDNLAEVTTKTTSNGYYIVTATAYTSSYNYAVLIGPAYSNHPSGRVGSAQSYDGDIFALCQ